MSIDLGELPAGWCSTDLGSLGRYLNGRGFKRSEWAGQGRPIIRIQNLTGSSEQFNYFEGEVDPKHEVQSGDLLMSWAATLGAYVWRGPSAVLNQHIFKVESFIDQAFHYHTLRWALEALYRNTHGSGMVHITKAKFDSTPVLLPPAPEQHRIVEAIESYFTRLDDAVATLERVRRNLKRYRASVLKAAVAGRLVPTEAELARAEGRDYEPASVLLERILAERRRRWEEAELAKMKAKGRTPRDDKWKLKYRLPAAPETTGLPALPEGWSWTTVESITSKVVDGVHKKPSYVTSGVPFVTVKNLTAGPAISFDNLRYITPEDHASFIRRANPERGDILISKDGTLGVVRAIRTDLEFSIFVSVALLKPVMPGMTDYLEVALSSPVVQSQMTPKGSGLQHIHLEDLRADCIPVPPLAEWPRILAELQRHTSIIGELEREVERDLMRCARLRQSILKWAFEGRLVDQNPSDEPASVLLDRIRAEREAAPARRSRSPRRARPRRRVRG